MVSRSLKATYGRPRNVANDLAHPVVFLDLCDEPSLLFTRCTLVFCCFVCDWHVLLRDARRNQPLCALSARRLSRPCRSLDLHLTKLKHSFLGDAVRSTIVHSYVQHDAGISASQSASEIGFRTHLML